MNKMETEEMFNRLSIINQIRVELLSLGGTVFSSSDEEILDNLDFIEEKTKELLGKIQLIKN